MRHWIAPLIIAAAQLIAVPASLANELAGQVMFAQGAASIERDGPTSALMKGSFVFEGDTIKTGDRARLQLLMVDGARIAIRPNTAFTIETYQTPDRTSDPVAIANGDGKIALKLLRGAFRSITGAIGKSYVETSYRVITPLATLGIRGTDYVARLCDGDCVGAEPGQSAEDGLYLGVNLGGVWVRNAAGELDIARNEYGFIASADTAPVRLLDPPAVLRQRLLSDHIAQEAESVASLSRERPGDQDKTAVAAAVASPEAPANKAKVGRRDLAPAPTADAPGAAGVRRNSEPGAEKPEQTIAATGQDSGITLSLEDGTIADDLEDLFTTDADDGQQLSGDTATGDPESPVAGDSETGPGDSAPGDNGGGAAGAPAGDGIENPDDEPGAEDNPGAEGPGDATGNPGGGSDARDDKDNNPDDGNNGKGNDDWDDKDNNPDDGNDGKGNDDWDDEDKGPDDDDRDDETGESNDGGGDDRDDKDEITGDEDHADKDTSGEDKQKAPDDDKDGSAGKKDDDKQDGQNDVDGESVARAPGHGRSRPDAAALLNAGGKILAIDASELAGVAGGGADPATGLEWGRWESGFGGAQPAHWVADRSASGEVILPRKGRLDYGLSGGTAPEDNHGNAGTLDSGSLQADFTNQTVTNTLSISLAGDSWQATGEGSISSGSPVFNGSYRVTRDSGAGGTGEFSGFFGGIALPSGAPSGAGVGYTLHSGATTVTGAAAFSALQSP